MKTLLLCSSLIFASATWGETVSVSCKSKYTEYRLEISEGSVSKLFYKGVGSGLYLYQLEEVEVDSNLNCRLQRKVPLIVDCSSENDRLVLGRSTGPEGVMKKVKARFHSVSRTIIDETVDGREEKVSNIFSYRIAGSLGEQVSPLRVKGHSSKTEKEETFNLDLSRGLQDTVECSIL